MKIVHEVFARMTIARAVTIGPLLLLLVMAVVPGWARYHDEVEAALAANRERARVSVQPILALVNASAAGGNYANVLTPEARDLFRVNKALLFFRVDARTDGGETWGMAYDREAGAVRRAVIDQNYIASLEDKMARANSALAAMSYDNPQRPKVERIIDATREELSTARADAEALKNLERTFQRPAADKLADGWFLDKADWRMHLVLPLDIRQGGAMWMVFDVSELATLGQRAFSRVAPITMGVLAFGWIAALMMARYIATPLTGMTGAMRALAEGNLNVGVPALDRGDEIGAMAQALAVFKDNAQKSERLAEQMIHSARQVAVATSQASSAVGQVSDGAHSQLTALRRLAKSVQQSTEAIADVSRSTQGASELSRTVANQVREGREHMRDVVDVVRGTADNAKRIEKMAASISRIADQTNMLALNAAIEAARAGDHGKGFAVVADEVRKLAEHSGELAAEIAELVRVATEESEKAVDVVGVVNSRMEAIAEDVRRNDSLTAAIATSMEQQQATVTEINDNVSSLTQIAQGNAAAAEEITATMVDLSRLAEQSRTQIEKFNNTTRSGEDAGMAKPVPA
jgi:methyl-accepting chemotaxis protein